MMKPDTWPGRVMTVAVASGLGIGIALIDRSAPFGDDSAQLTSFL